MPINERCRQRAWLLTALSSLVCSFAGVGFLGRVAIDGFSGEFGRPDEPADRRAAARCACTG